jgi:hypothetical protein
MTSLQQVVPWAMLRKVLDDSRECTSVKGYLAGFLMHVMTKARSVDGIEALFIEIL